MLLSSKLCAVFDEERRRVNAWAKAFESSGYDAAQEAEREEVLLIRKEKDEADERNRHIFEQMMRAGQEIKRQREMELSRSNLENVHTSVNSQESAPRNPFSGEEIVPVPESNSLRDQREKRLEGILKPPSETANRLSQQAESVQVEALNVEPAGDEHKLIEFAVVQEIETEQPEGHDVLAIDCITLEEEEELSKEICGTHTAIADTGNVLCDLISTASIVSNDGTTTTDLFELD
jgi:hypothetical protein